MLILEGLATSTGIAVGSLLLLQEKDEAPAMRTAADPAVEWARTQQAIETAKEQLQMLYDKTLAQAGEKSAAIFEIHSMMLEDDDYLDNIRDVILQEKLCGEYAVYITGRQFGEVFKATGDEYMAERAVDVVDISGRVVDILQGGGADPMATVKKPVIVAAAQLLPSQTVQMDKSKVLGFISQRGSMNSHASILARSLGIPAVSELGEGFARLVDGEEVILDGVDGVVVREATPDVRRTYKEKIRALAAEQDRLRTLVGQPAVTLDGARIELCANIGHPDEVAPALAQDAEGIGLFRSEFLYLGAADFPSEQAQFEAYKSVLCEMAPRRVVVRTLDLGADKQAPYLNISDEENPAMGYRAIRICLDRTDIFLPQLRALLRASVYGRLAVMFPMVTSVEEVREIFQVLEVAKQSLRDEGIAYSDEVEYGIMIETPAAVMMADKLAAEVDFFSIGTNDLTQYTFAADRMNPKIAHLFNAASPAVLRMIRKVADEAHKQGIWVGICGESAADSSLLPCYIACGIDELSMSPQSILKVKEMVRTLKKADCVAQCDEMLR